MYAIDIVVSTGEGKAKLIDEKQTSVFKRALDMEYNLKMKVKKDTADSAISFCVALIPQSLADFRHQGLCSRISTSASHACRSPFALWTQSSQGSAS